MPSLISRLQDELKLGLTCFNKLWTYETKNWVTSIHAADINQDGDIEVLAGSRDGRAHALTRDGRLIWSHVIGTKAWVTAISGISLPLDQQETRVITSTRDGRLYALDKDGEILSKERVLSPLDRAASVVGSPLTSSWYNVPQAILRLHTAPSAPLDVLFGSEDRCAYSFDMARGELRWRFPTGGKVEAVFTADVNGDGHLEYLVGSSDHTLSVLSASGKLLTSRQMEQAILTLFAADLDNDGAVEILVGTRAKKLVALTPDLCMKWSTPLSSRPLSLCVADVNNDRRSEILVSCDDKSLYILDDAGKQLWRQGFDARFYSLFALDLDLDGDIEVLAGAEDKHIYVWRVQLHKELDKKIRRAYAALGKPEPEMLPALRGEQRELLMTVIGTTSHALDKNLTLEHAENLLAQGEVESALLTLLKLEQQRFQLLWEKGSIGYANALCLSNLAGDSRREVIVGSLDGFLSAFSASGRLLWSKNFLENQISDVQSGYYSRGRAEDLVLLSSSGQILTLNAERRREVSPFAFPEAASCFYLLAPTPQGSSEMLIGLEDGRAYRYTNANSFQNPVQGFTLPAGVQAVYASEPFEGRYRPPEILISTSADQLFAYTRGGNLLWTFEAHDRILAFCAKDLDGDGSLEILVGSEDRNIHVLDYQGHLRWRYVLPHSVLALEAADLDNDGHLEILAGGADGVLYVFTHTGDLIWRYQARDRILALHAGDIDQDGNREIALVLEDRLEILQVLDRAKLSELVATCWSRLLAGREPLDALLPYLKNLDPHLRAATLRYLADLKPLPANAFDLFEHATQDSFVRVRSVLPEVVTRAYPADPVRGRALLDLLYRDTIRAVRIEVVEHLDILAHSDWAAVLSYLSRAAESTDRNTRHAALRKISHLIGQLPEFDKSLQKARAEDLLKLLLDAALDRESEWIRQEAGRVLADLLNLYPEDSFRYFYRFLTSRLQLFTLEYTVYNLASPVIQRSFTQLLNLCFKTEISRVLDVLPATTYALEAVRGFPSGADIWLICREVQELSSISTLQDLASYEFRLNSDQFQPLNMRTQSFLRIAERFSTITRVLKTYQRRADPNDRLNSLLDGLATLDALQSATDQAYGASAVPGSPQPHLPEYILLKALLARWQEMFQAQRNELRGNASLACSLQSQRVHFEEAVGIWLKIENQGRGAANNVKVTLLSGDGFEVQRSSFETDTIFARQEVVAEFFIQPLKAPLTLTFEVFFDDVESDSQSFTYQERLTFIEWQREFTFIDNPYSTGTPLQDSRMCYGRENDLAYLQDNLTRTTAQTVLVLYGQRRSGKTTLLYQLANTPLLAQHIPVMIDLQRLAYNLDLGNFLFKVAYAIYQAVEKRDLHIARPQRVDFVEQNGAKPDPIFSFDCFLDEIEMELHERKLILLLDEFEVLEDQVHSGELKPEIFQYLRSLMQQRQYMHFLLSGTHHIEELTRDYWSVFFNIALHYRLPGKITESGAEALITHPVKNALEYDTLAVKKIRQLTADQPYLIHLVCRSLVDHCNQQRKNYATLNDVDSVMRYVMDSGAAHFGWLWDQLEPARQLLLRVIAEGSRDEGRQLSIKDIADMYQRYHFPYHHDEVTSALKTLWAEDVIETSDGAQLESLFDGSYYHVSIGLLRQWLRREKPLVTNQKLQERSLPSVEIEPSALNSTGD